MGRGGRRYGIEAEKEERVREAGVRGGQERGRRVREGKRSEGGRRKRRDRTIFSLVWKTESGSLIPRIRKVRTPSTVLLCASWWVLKMSQWMR